MIRVPPWGADRQVRTFSSGKKKKKTKEIQRLERRVKKKKVVRDAIPRGGDGWRCGSVLQEVKCLTWKAPST